MNKKILLFGTLPIAAIAMTMVFSYQGSNESVYQPRKTDKTDVNGASGYLEYFHLLRGDFTKEDYWRGHENAMAGNHDRASMQWIDQGPDNIGGRTRAICVDKRDVNHVLAGGVSGGLWESYNRANTWHRVVEFDENLGISSICQTADGTFYVATGHERETSSGYQGGGYNGNGVYEVLSDGVTNSVNPVSGTENYDWVNYVVADTLTSKTFYMATDEGLKKYSNGTISAPPTGEVGDCPAVSVSPDGNVIACVIGAKTVVSDNGGSSFTTVSGNINNGAIPTSSARLELAVTWDKGSNGKHYVYAIGSKGDGRLNGVWRSTSNGASGSWVEIAPDNDGTPGSFAPFDVGIQFQGWWDQHVASVHGNPEKCIIGGIDCYSWSTNGNWEQISNGYTSQFADMHMHPDQHVMITDQWGRMYFGNDGGIYFSDDNGQSFHPANRGYNVATCYSVGYSAHGDVVTGMQDNGTTANYHDNTTWKEHDVVGGGDGFSAHMSFINRNVIFSSVYYASLRRTSDRGGNSTSFTPTDWGCTPGTDCGPFATVTELWEDPDDELSQDTIDFIPSQGYSAGDSVEVPSQTVQTTIYYITPTDVVYDDTVDFDPAETIKDTIITTIDPSSDYNLSIVDYTHVSGGPAISAGDSLYLVDLDTTIEVDSYITVDHYFGTNPLRPGKIVDMGYEGQIYGVAWDTLKVQDRFQSWFAVGLNGEVWMTRNALRFSAPSNEWFKVAEFSGTVMTMEFTKNGEHLFIGTTGGYLYRLSGFNSVYSPAKEDDPLTGAIADTLIDWDAGHYATTLSGPFGAYGGPITGIATGGINDPDHVVITVGGFNGTGKVKESTDATTGSPTFNSITGSGGNAFPSNIPVYSALIDRDDPNLILVGCEFGVWRTENGGAAWEDVSGDFGLVPVYDMGQNWRTWNEGCFKPGSIYIGTHGRGVWSTDEYLGAPEIQDNLATDKFVSNITVYPNPLNAQGTLAFNLESNSDVYVQIFNLSGQLVDEITESNMSAGANNINFSADALPKGTYIIRLTAGSMVETTKFIKR